MKLRKKKVNFLSIVISSVVKRISGKGFRRTERGYIDKKF